ncbi:MAG: histidine kinase [Burkholderiales bacterium]|nr:MAG: histidine kinase [Burkholderiales bacterium]
MVAEPAFWSYAAALAAFTLFALQLWLGWRGGRNAALLLTAVALSAGWAGSGLAVVLSGSPMAWSGYRGLDALRILAWLAFLFSLLHRGEGSGRGLSSSAGPFLLAVIFLATPWLAPALSALDLQVPQALTAYGGSLAVSVLGLATVEQLYRRAPKGSRWHVAPLCIGLGGAFAFDLYVYADALLFRRPLDPDLWSARGVAQALVIPFVALSTARSREWTIDIAFSRGVVFHSTAIMAAGLYLLAIAAAGYYVRYFGGAWGRTLQIGFLFAALLLLGLVFSSGTFRSQVRVFINKHFFSYRYDYRQEWLKITRLLSGAGEGANMHERCVMALADLVESPAGAIWLEDHRGRYVQAGRWNMREVNDAEPAEGALPSFLGKTGWVVDLDEFRAHPERYPDLRLPEWLARLPNAWLIVPLPHLERLLGFVILATARVKVEINWEVRDLLKTAARQVAGFIGHARATEALLESRKFEAFNRMSAFVVHDLKNLVAQLSLMLKNAERHQGNPEFQQDMLATIRNVVERMNGLLFQLRAGTQPLDHPRTVDLAALVERVAQAKSAQGRRIAWEAQRGVQAVGHAERLERVIGHLVQNALEATDETGRVELKAYFDGAHAVVDVADNGKGMTPEFVRDELFKPFRTTKPAGTGIGAYESAQYVAELGGKLLVDSRPGEGTRIRMLLPRPERRPLEGEKREVA